jgi:branched-chain amino acid transport system ATP-binding protein
MRSETPLLEVNSIDLYYDSFRAAHDVCLEINEGEIVSLIGANGAGKTTILNAICGQVHPTKGNIKFKGERIDQFRTDKVINLGLALVPEGRRIFSYLTVEENLLMGCYPKRARGERKRLFKRVYELFPLLEERRKQTGGTLSGGEQQMLAIGRALMSDPELLMCDEMTLGLAPVITDTFYGAIKTINDQGIALLLVDQDVRQILNVVNKAYIIESGRVALSGTPLELAQEETIKKAFFGI